MDEKPIFQGSQIPQPPVETPVANSGFPPVPEAPTQRNINIPSVEHKELVNPSFQSEETLSHAEPTPQSESSPEGENVKEKKRGLSGLIKIIPFLIGIIVVVFIIYLISVISPRLMPATSGKVTLEYWGLWEDGKTMNSIISDFEKANPNITVNYTKQDIKQYRQKLEKRIDNGTGPDIFRFHNTWPIMLYSYLLPLPTDTISPSDFKKWFYPVMQKDLIKNGAIYGIPLGIDTLELYVNTDILKASGTEAPQNWEDFASTATALTVKDASGEIKTSGVALGTSNNVVHAPDIVSLLFAQNGVNLEDISSNSKNLSQALQYYTSYANGDGKIWDQNQDSSLLAFAKGNLAMCFGYSWDYFTITALNPNLNFKIIKAPKLANKDLTIASYWVEGVSVKSKHQKEALLFMKYLAQKETEQKLYSEESKTRAFGEPYARMDLADTLKTNPAVYPFVENAVNATSSYFADGTYDQGLNDELNTYLNTAIDSVLNNTSPDSAADTLSSGFTQTLQKYGK